MKLPGSEQAVVEEAKISGYLLSESHSVGKFKAPFFMALGYSANAWETLAADLRNLAANNEAVPTLVTAYGQKYEVRGSLTGPGGRTAGISTIWIVLHGENVARFVTAVPRPRT